MFLAASAALATLLAAPSIVRAAGTGLLRFIRRSDVTILDPIWTTAYVTRNHGFMIFDTLYGLDNAYQARPQMVEGHNVENDGKLWKLTCAKARRGTTGSACSPAIAWRQSSAGASAICSAKP
jgi:peptide/nickel transport system substrate-binding protein